MVEAEAPGQLKQSLAGQLKQALVEAPLVETAAPMQLKLAGQLTQPRQRGQLNQPLHLPPPSPTHPPT